MRSSDFGPNSVPSRPSTSSKISDSRRSSAAPPPTNRPRPASTALNPIEDWPGLHQIPLYNEPTLLVARAGHPTQQAHTLPELLHYPWIVPLQQTALKHDRQTPHHVQAVNAGKLPRRRAIPCVQT
ncbi:LysR substrate-binding domain-containing protein [Nonomuraea sp. C10]|uniref:LysR substrate-binding domain-containing protein n=1 Tax=Nonomuraea sp. C10 TaxID=2600577 RepID=UPI0037C9640F